MMISKNLAEYHVWSCKKYRELIASIPEEDYTKVINNRTIEGITSHIVAALFTCFYTIEGSDDKFWEWLEEATMKQILERWQELDIRLLKLALALPTDSVNVPHVSETPFSLASEDFVMQYILHTIHHRGQLSLLLRDLGYDVPGTDYLHFFAEK
ncbi:MAG: DinB family protein [Candidatus Thorarchaeota archaeon]|nr:DinB family protein [Candidatus Thorarchaeota archaeon]